MIAAVRVPPSAWITSQSMVIWRSPSAGRSSTARRLRPISRWISMVRPDCLPAEASRRVRSDVARGSMPYSAVIQPRPWPFSQGGSRSSSVAVTSTWVSPNFTKHEPSAYFTTPRSSETARSSSGARRLGRMAMSFGFSKTPCFVSRARASGKGVYGGVESMDANTPARKHLMLQRSGFKPARSRPRWSQRGRSEHGLFLAQGLELAVFGVGRRRALRLTVSR